MAATFTGTCRYMSPERIQRSLFSFAADVWSVGLVLLECALGRYPYPEASTYIEAAESIVELPAPTVPPELRSSFTPEFLQLLSSCLVKKAEERLPADILLGSPWFARHGIVDLESSIRGMHAWLATVPGVLLPSPMPHGYSPSPAGMAAAAPPAAAAVSSAGIGFALLPSAAGGAGAPP